jgi:pyrroline-5-carboxylate reductase
VDAGRLGASIIRGLCHTGYRKQIIASTRSESSRDALQEKYGIATKSDNQKLVDESSVLVLGVKPYQLQEMLSRISVRDDHLILSLAAGVRCETIHRWLKEPKAKIIRCMPNIAASVGESMSILTSTQSLSPAQILIANGLMNSIGECLWVDSEEQFDVATTVAGCGPAYLFYFMNALTEALQKNGLSPESSSKIVKQVLCGSSKLDASVELVSQEWIAKVCTPGGVTAAAIGVFDEQKIPEKIESAIVAAKNRCEEMAFELEKKTVMPMRKNDDTSFFRKGCAETSFRNPFNSKHFRP